MAVKETLLAIGLSVGGSLVSTSYQWGVVNDKIATNSLATAAQQVHIDAIAADKVTQAAQNAKIDQSLEDIKQRLNRIENKL